MPFGLTNAPATFQRLMEKVLAGLQWKILALYLDDVIVFAGSPEEHLDRLAVVLERCRVAGLRLKPKKCDLLRRSVSFLGHVVDASGIHTDPEKVQKVVDWPIPLEATHVRSFIGLTSYYRRFIRNYASISSPLHDLTRKDVPFLWTDAAQLAFDCLKRALVERVCLALPEVDGGDYVLDTDASAFAIGAVLSQIQDGIERVLAFGSRCLNKAERNYCVTRRELLAVVYFMVYYRHYLMCRRVTVRSDHGCLRWLKQMRYPSGQVARWIERLAPFDWCIEYRPGARHQNADSLSRIPCPGDCPQCLRIQDRETQAGEEERLIQNCSYLTDRCPGTVLRCNFLAVQNSDELPASLSEDL